MKQTKKIFLLGLIGALALSSLGFSATRRKSTRTGNLVREFTCENYQEITVENISNNKIKFADGYGGIFYLNATKTASGEIYENKDMSVQIKGKEAGYTSNDKTLLCSLKRTYKGNIKE